MSEQDHHQITEVQVAEPAKKKRKRKRKQKTDDDVKNADSDPASADAPTSSQASSSSMANDCTAFIEGFPFDSSEEGLKEFFSGYGCSVESMRLPVWQDTGRLRGFGHVVFASEDDATRAIEEVSGKSIGKRYIVVKKPNVPKQEMNRSGEVRDQPKGCKLVFVKNLPYDSTESDLHEAFSTFGKVLEGGCRIARNQNNENKGFGFVEFKEPEFALAAVQQASKPFGLKVGGRPVFVDFEEGKAKGSFRLGDGQFYSKVASERNGAGGRGGRGVRGGRGGRGRGGSGRGGGPFGSGGRG